MCALVAAKIVGPRTKRFRNGIPNRMPQQSPALQTLGALILWVGWYGFNGGSVGSVSNGRSSLVAAAVVNTTISAAASVLCVGLWLKIVYKKIDSGHLNNGILSGLVAISASGSLVQPEGAFIIGAVASAFYMVGTEGLKWFKIDDVVQASAVHLMCGAWGVVSVGLFATRNRYQDVYSYGIFSDPVRDEECCGREWRDNFCAGPLNTPRVTIRPIMSCKCRPGHRRMSLKSFAYSSLTKTWFSWPRLFL